VVGEIDNASPDPVRERPSDKARLFHHLEDGTLSAQQIRVPPSVPFRAFWQVRWISSSQK